MAKNTKKPIVTSAYDTRGVNDLIDMASIIKGSRDLSEKPFMIHLMASLSPLVHPADVLGKLLICAERKIPVIFSTAQAGGSTAPVTLAGELIVSLAEGLSALAIAQLKSEGAPVIMPGWVSNADMRTIIPLYGSPELSLLICALADIYHWLGLPTFGTAGCTDAKVADEQAAMESAFSCVTQALSGSNFIHDIGYLESGLTGSLDLLVMTHELLGMIRRFKRGINLDKESLAVDLIDRVGIGGHYLLEEHTLQHFRVENWQADLFDKSGYEEWSSHGRKTLTDRAKERIREVMSQPKSSTLDKRQTEELSKIIKKRENEE